MAEAAVLYYEKKYTQQQVAQALDISRQTVSKLLNDAVREQVVEIKIHDPRQNCRKLEQQLCEKFQLDDAVVCPVGSTGNTVRQIMTVRTAVEYILPLVKKGGLKIAVSWGRTIKEFVAHMPQISTRDNVVFPLFGATDQDDSCFSSNEMARTLAGKLGALVQPAWFPYLTDNAEDRVLLEKTSYCKKIKKLWESIDLALVGIGNTQILQLFGQTFGHSINSTKIVGDIATRFFDAEGNIETLYENTLCACAQDIKNARRTVAIACGDDKISAISGGLKTGLINVLVTDEYTAKQLLSM